MIMTSQAENVYSNSMNAIPEEMVYESRAWLTSSPFRADDLSDISFAAEATDEVINDGDDQSIDPSSENPLKLVNIEKTEKGFGFNIVGGVDSPHFPGDASIYVSSVNPASKAYKTIRVGDKILTFDGFDLTNVSHDEAVNIFRKVKQGQVAKMLIDRDYVLPEDRTQNLNTTTSAISSNENKIKIIHLSKSEQASVLANSKSGRLTPLGVAMIVERIRGKANIDEDDARSVTSYAPSTHSIIDDVPRTPRKPMSLLDPRNNSLFTEALYVSIGVGALTLSGYLVYRFLRGRH